MPRGQHLWDAAGLVSLPLFLIAIVYFNVIIPRFPQTPAPSASALPEVQENPLLTLSPAAKLWLGLGVGGVATAVYSVAHLLTRQDLERAVREQPTELLRNVEDADDHQDEPMPASSSSPAHVATNSLLAAPSAPEPAPPVTTMNTRVEEILNSLKCRWQSLADETWLAEIRRFHGYPIRLHVKVDRDFLLLQVQAALIPEQAWDPNVLAGTLLDAHVGMQYGSFRTVNGPAGRLVALAQICDTRYLPTPLLREIARRLIEQYLDMVQKLYALDLIEDGSTDDEWGSLC